MDNTEEELPADVITSDTENATRVEPKDAPPSKRDKFLRFRFYNTGTWNGPKRENKEVTHRQDNLHRYDAVSSSLNLTDYQKGRGRKLLDTVDFQELGLKIDAVIFGICVIVANADVNDGTRYWPHPKSDKNDKKFAEIADSLGMTRREQLSIVQQLRPRLDI